MQRVFFFHPLFQESHGFNLSLASVQPELVKAGFAMYSLSEHIKILVWPAVVEQLKVPSPVINEQVTRVGGVTNVAACAAVMKYMAFQFPTVPITHNV